MDKYLEPTTKGKIYFYSYFLFAFFMWALGKYFLPLFPPQGNEIEKIKITVAHGFVVVVIKTIIYMVLAYVVYFLARSSHKHMQWPPPDAQLPFRVKIKPIKNPKMIWLCAGMLFFSFGLQIVASFYSWYLVRTTVYDVIEMLRLAS